MLPGVGGVVAAVLRYGHGGGVQNRGGPGQVVVVLLVVHGAGVVTF